MIQLKRQKFLNVQKKIKDMRFGDLRGLATPYITI